MIYLNDVGIGYGGQTILSGIDFEIAGPGVFGILGPSGIGKTTLLQVLAVIRRQKQGDLFINGTNTKRLGIYERMRLWQRTISFHFQINNVIPQESLQYNVAFRRRLPETQQERIQAMCNSLGLDVALTRKAGSLSVGQKNRLSIVRAFYRDTPVVLLDEPLASLDKVSRARVVEMIEQASQQRTVVVSTHEDELRELCVGALNLMNHVRETVG